jgi:hypothetical protein
MTDEMDQHPSLREHLGLRERVTVLEGGQVSITQALNRIEARQLTQQAPHAPQETAAALALHRALDALDGNKRTGGNSVGQIILITLALIGVGVTAFVIGKAF